VRIDFQTLRVFAAAADTQNITKAAEREFIAPSAVSKRVSDLEESAEITKAVTEGHSGIGVYAGSIVDPGNLETFDYRVDRFWSLHTRWLNQLSDSHRTSGSLSGKAYPDSWEAHVMMYRTHSCIGLSIRCVARS
jgi:hypothetical protein